MLGKAAGKAVTGAESRQAAMRQCIKEMSEKGIPAFVDKRGREWSPEAYINMDIRTTVSNAAHQAQFDRMEDYGLNLVEVSSHNGARPKCAKDQGKIFNRSGKGGYTTDLHGKSIRYYAWSDSSYGEPDGLLGINCGHHIYPFIPGISYQTYFPYDEEENKEQYKKIQNQRELERRVRKSKRECMMLEKTGDTEGLQKAKETLKTRQQALKQYCTDNDLKYKPDRTAVVDYKKSVSGFTPSDEKNRITEIKAKAVDKSGGSGIIKAGEAKNMSINAIELPIEQQHTGKGNPNAILMFGTDLNNRQKKLLNLLPEFDSRITVPKKSVNMADLSALTAQTGHEFAMFTKGSERLIIRGNTCSVNITVEDAKKLAKNGYKWSGHTHPGAEFNCLIASSGDKAVLQCFNHKTSVIYNSKGNYATFEKGE